LSNVVTSKGLFTLPGKCAGSVKVVIVITSLTVGIRNIVLCDERIRMYVCLSVCLSVGRISLNLNAQTSESFLYMLSGSVARSSSYDSGIRYVLPVLHHVYP